MNRFRKVFIFFASGVIFLTAVCEAREKTVLLLSFGGNEDGILNPRADNYWYQIKQACDKVGYNLTTKQNQNPEDVVAIVAFNATRPDILKRYPCAKKILYTWEPPIILSQNFSKTTHDEFDIVATWDDGLVDGLKYRKFNYALLFSPPSSYVPFDQKKLCCAFIGRKHSSFPNELYSKRLETINFFEKNAPEDLEFFGSGWSSEYKTYRGYASDKVKSSKNYKFGIVYENTQKIQGYITEKIFDAFSGGCVPVYWGASNIAEHIPANCFIAREQFSSDAELYSFLKEMSEETYNSYLQSIADFLRSDKGYVFSRERYIETFIDLLQVAESL